MTRDEIIRTALADTMLIDGIEQVARAAYEAGAAAEREACARVCEVRSEGWNQARTKDDYQMCALGAKNEARALAAAIRARGEK